MTTNTIKRTLRDIAGVVFSILAWYAFMHFTLYLFPEPQLRISSNIEWHYPVIPLIIWIVLLIGLVYLIGRKKND